jgi:2-oxoglutarate dehydrogenase E2 component (dihydrolipoamide succinyltransferase)
VLKELKFKAGDTVTSSQVIAIIEEGAVAAAPAPAAAAPAAARARSSACR